MSKDKPVNDMTAFERQAGLHLSVGKKHNVFKKPGVLGRRFSALGERHSHQIACVRFASHTHSMRQKVREATFEDVLTSK